MPIKGLTDTVAPRFPRLGKLRKGAEKPEQGNKPGADLDYFRFDGEPDVTAAFISAYGREPRALAVYLPFAAPDECFQAWKEQWSAGGLVHRCDGQTMTIWRTPAGTYSREPKPCAGGCDEVARLEVVLPEMIRAGHVGYVTLETHGLNDMLGIQATLLAAYVARKDLRGIEFVLRRVEREISTPGQNGQRVRRTKWIVELAPAPRWAQVQLAMAQSAAYALPEPAETVDAATGEIEYTPPAQPPAPAPAQQSPDPRPMPTTLADAYKQGHQDGVKTHGNGHKPVNNAPPTDKRRLAVQKTWEALWQTARQLKLEPEGVDGDISTDDWIERGKALRKAVMDRANRIVNTHPAGVIKIDDTDEQILSQAIWLMSVPVESNHVPA